MLVQLVMGSCSGKVSEELARDANVLHLLPALLTVLMQIPSQGSAATSSQMLCRAEGLRLLR